MELMLETLQTCLAHLVRHCHEPAEKATARAVRFPRAGAIRPRGLRVANGKLSSGGNRSHRDAETQAVLMSLLRTAHQKHIDPFARLTAILRDPTPQPQPPLLS